VPADSGFPEPHAQNPSCVAFPRGWDTSATLRQFGNGRAVSRACDWSGLTLELKSNQLWNCSRLEKTSGRMKWRRDHSSARLFWRGVPDRSSLLLVFSSFSSRICIRKNEQ
jgi:hypothetical protein